MRRRTIAECAREVLLENKQTGIMWGDSYMLEDIAERAGVRPKISHPLNRWHLVLAGLERAPHLFEKFYVPIHIQNQRREVRSFQLKEARPHG